MGTCKGRILLFQESYDMCGEKEGGEREDGGPCRTKIGVAREVGEGERKEGWKLSVY